MQPKRSKYDTNPLDENVAQSAERSWSRDTAGQDLPTADVSGAATRDIGRTANEAARLNPETEAPTRRIDDSYPSVFSYGQPGQATYQAPHPLANIYQPPPVPPAQVYQRPPAPVMPEIRGQRKVTGLGIAEKWAVAFPYLPLGFFIAIVAAVVELFLVPRNETRVRFHAAQGLVLQVGVAAVSTLLGFADLAFSGRFTGAGLFRFGAFIFLLISMIRAWKGKSHHIAILDPATRWVDEKIGPRK
jgi:uncharacterized membrane protein